MRDGLFDVVDYRFRCAHRNDYRFCDWLCKWKAAKQLKQVEYKK